MKSFGWFLLVFAVLPLMIGCIFMTVLFLSPTPEEPYEIWDYLIIFATCPLPALIVSGLSIFFGQLLVRKGKVREDALMARFPQETPIAVRISYGQRSFAMPPICVACGQPASGAYHTVGLYYEKSGYTGNQYRTTTSLSFPLCAACEHPKSGAEKKRIRRCVEVSTKTGLTLIFSNESFAGLFAEMNKQPSVNQIRPF